MTSTAEATLTAKEMSTTTTTATSTTATTSAVDEHAAPDAHFRRPVASRRRLSTFQGAIPHSCHQLPHSVEALDLSLTSLPPTLVSLRHHVLSYLADLEARLSLLESAESLMAKGESTIEEVRDWARDGLEMLRGLREDVCSHLPDLFTLEGVPSVEEFVSAHAPDVPNLPDVRSHLPDMPDVRSHLPDFKLPDVRSRLDDVRSCISDIDFNRPLSFVPTLSTRLQSLQAHLSSTDFPSSMYLSTFAPSATLSALLEKVMSSHLVADLSSDLRSGEETLEKAALEIARAMKRSLNGSRLIQYVDLPEKWRNNPFVKGGYRCVRRWSVVRPVSSLAAIRFIPLHDWPRLILSLFALHNETRTCVHSCDLDVRLPDNPVNIHTHLIPFLLWSFAWFRFSPSYDLSDTHEPAKVTFTVFALLCLFTSALWHTMAGCAHPEGMEFCARVDYVGIGW